MKKILSLCFVTLLLAGCGASSRGVSSGDSVNIGYGTQDKDKLTTAVSNVKVKKTEAQTYTDMYEYLRGRVPGVTVTSDKRIIIRGIGTHHPGHRHEFRQLRPAHPGGRCGNDGPLRPQSGRCPVRGRHQGRHLRHLRDAGRQRRDHHPHRRQPLVPARPKKAASPVTEAGCFGGWIRTASTGSAGGRRSSCGPCG